MSTNLRLITDEIARSWHLVLIRLRKGRTRTLDSKGRLLVNQPEGRDLPDQLPRFKGSPALASYYSAEAGVNVGGNMFVNGQRYYLQFYRKRWEGLIPGDFVLFNDKKGDNVGICNRVFDHNPFGDSGNLPRADIEFHALHSDYMFPGRRHANSGSTFYRKISRDDALNRLDTEVSRLEKKVEEGGLTGAVAASNLWFFGQLVKNVKTASDPLEALGTEIRWPRTGVYVVRGVYKSKDDARKLYYDCIKYDGSIWPAFIIYTLKEICPRGFGNIPPTAGYGEKHYKLETYSIYPVPEEALHLLKKPHQLRIGLS